MKKIDYISIHHDAGNICSKEYINEKYYKSVRIKRQIKNIIFFILFWTFVVLRGHVFFKYGI